MDSNTSSSKKEEEEEYDNHTPASREPTSRTSISSNDSNFIVQSPSVLNAIPDTFTPARHSIDELRDLHHLSRQALSRRLSTLSTTSSFGDVGDGSLNWNPREAGVNGAISNVLSNAQSPAARQKVSKPTTRDIPAVTLTNLPIVTYASFEPYLASIGPDYERHRRFKQGLLEEHIRIGSKETSVVPASSFTDLIDSKLLANISTSNLSTTTLDDTLPPSPSPRRRPFRNREEEPEPLDTVPSVFFDSNFSLSNPRTFDIVNEHSDLLTRTGTGKPDRKSLASNAILQEKLSWYMDTVEIHLIKEINAASVSFFAALSDLQELNEDASKCVAKIAKLREELGRIQDTHALQGADVTKLHIKRANIARLQQAVDLVSKIAKMKDQIEELLERKENGQAYQLMQDIKAIMETSEGDASLINLRRVEALRNIDAEMANVLSRIGNSQGNDLTKTLITDLRSWVNSTNTQATLRRLSETFNRDTTRKDTPNISSPAHITVPEDVRATVIQQLQGLQQTRFLDTGMELYRKEIVKEVKSIIKKNLPSTDDDTESVMSSFASTNQSNIDRKERSQALAKNLRQMSPEIFIEMITTTYSSLVEFFRRLQTHQKLLLDLTALSGTVPADLSEVLNNIMDISSARIQKILGVRAEQNSHLAPREFYIFLAATRLFSLECERISGKAPTVLMATVNSQARGFVSWLHLDRVKLLGAAIDRDKWKSEDVLAVTQKQTSFLVESATRDPISWVKFVRVDSMENVNGVNDSMEKTLSIEEEKFFIVGCVVVLLGILEEYCIAIIALPPLQSDIAANLIELYNSRVMQAILRAGATKTAGLKSIMARHLAFASQALGVIISLIPYIREHTRRHLGNTNPSIAEFDRTKRALQVHQDEIHTKLITIMDDRLKAHARTFDKIDWESFPEGKTVHPYAETIITETSTLHNVLKRYLSPMVVEMIMEGVFASYISRLTDEYTKIETLSPKVRETMLADASHITEKLSQLPGVRKMDQGLIQAVEAREVTSPKQPSENMENRTKKSSSSKEGGNGGGEVLFDASQHESVEKEETSTPGITTKDNV